jgi:hypothetical protein
VVTDLFNPPWRKFLQKSEKDIDVYAEGADQSDDLTMLEVRFLGKIRLEQT